MRVEANQNFVKLFGCQSFVYKHEPYDVAVCLLVLLPFAIVVAAFLSFSSVKNWHSGLWHKFFIDLLKYPTLGIHDTSERIREMISTLQISLPALTLKREECGTEVPKSSPLDKSPPPNTLNSEECLSNASMYNCPEVMSLPFSNTRERGFQTQARVHA